MNKEEWEAMRIKTIEKIKNGELNDESWEEFIHNYVEYECGISHEFLWNYKGIEYGLYPLEDFGKYEYMSEETKESVIYKDIWDALENIRIDEKTLRELYEDNQIFFNIT